MRAELNNITIYLHIEVISMKTYSMQIRRSLFMGTPV